MPGLVQLPRIGDLPAKGNPVGFVFLAQLIPTGDRGLTFGRSDEDGVPLGKIPGYWTCPYSGTITGVILNTDQGGYTIRVWKTQTGRSPIPADNISNKGYSIKPSATHLEFFDTSDFIFTDVLPGDTFAVEIVAVTPPTPTDIAGNVVILKLEGAP